MPIVLLSFATAWASAPRFTLQPASITVDAGQTVEFVTAVEADPSPDLQWQFQGMDLPEAHGSNLVLLAVHTNQTGTYQLVASNSFGVVTSTPAILTVVPIPPTIFQDPTNLTVFEGQSARFEVSLASGPFAEFQWRFNGLDIPGATAPFLAFSTTHTTDAGQYTVVVTNPYGAVTSQVAVLTINPAPTNAGSVDHQFATGAGALPAQVNAVLVLRDGMILIGGDFTSFDGELRHRLARLLPDGKLDPSFHPESGPNGPIYALAEQADGRVIIGGLFTYFGEHAANYLARFNVDGSVDETFVSDLPLSFVTLAPVDVRALLVQADGRILHAGSVYWLGRREADGSSDLTFRTFLQPTSDGAQIPRLPAFALAPDADGRILVGGYFGLRRFHPSGAIDTSFANLAASGLTQVRAVTTLRSGRILAGGNFGLFGAVPRRALACLEADGSLAPVFTNVFTNTAIVNALATTADGKVLIAGSFNAIAGVPCGSIARLLADGTLDQSFNADLRPELAAPVVQPLATLSALATKDDGSTLVGGNFTALSGFVRGAIGQLHGDTPATPLLRTQPASQNAVAGTAVSLFVDGIYPPGTEHQWRFGGANLSGATNPVLALVDLDLADAGDYSVVLKNSFGAVTSEVATVTVTAAPTNIGATDLAFGRGSGADGPVLCSVPTLGGKILIAGLFRQVHGIARDYVARLHPDGSLDESFDAGRICLERPIHSGPGVVAMTTDELGRVYLGGSFTNIQGVSRRGVARVDAEGRLDLDYGANAIRTGTVLALVRQPDGVVYLGGDFLTGALRQVLARLDANGHLDEAWVPSVPVQIVYSLGLQGGAGIIVGGDFPTLGRHLLRLKQNGTVDGTFNAGAFSERAPRTLAVQPTSGRIYLAALVTPSVVPSSERILCLNSNGTVLAGFNPMAHAVGTVRHLALDGCGRLLVGTTSTNVNGLVRTHLARLDAAGFADPSFHPVLDGTVWSILPRAWDDEVFVVGEFSFVNGVRRRCFAQLLGAPVATPVITDQPTGWFAYTGQDFTLSIGLSCPPAPSLQWFRNGVPVPGATNTTLRFPNALASQAGQYTVVVTNFLGSQTSAVAMVMVTPPEVTPARVDFDFFPGPGPGPDGPVRALALQTDGKLWIGGDFTNVQGTARQSLARLNRDGSLDLSFDPALLGSFDPNRRAIVHALALQDDGALLVGGSFLLRQNTRFYSSLARLTVAGLLDLSFASSSIGDPETRAILPTPAGKIILGRLSAGLEALSLPTGAWDSTFLGNVNSSVFGLANSPGGHLVCGGAFTLVNGVTRNRIARLTSKGNLDPAFDPDAGPSDVVNAVAVQSDSKVIMGGLFTQVAGVPRNRLARLNTDGTLDASFDPNCNGAVNAIAIAPNGSIYIAGSFTFVGGFELQHVARLHPDGTIDRAFHPGAGANASVFALLLQPDGRLDLGGAFSTYDGTIRARVVRLHGQVVVMDAGIDARGFQGSVATATGRNYHLESTESLQTPVWTVTSSAAGNGLVQTLTDPSPQRTRFYRIRVE